MVFPWANRKKLCSCAEDSRSGHGHSAASTLYAARRPARAHWPASVILGYGEYIALPQGYTIAAASSPLQGRVPPIGKFLTTRPAEGLVCSRVWAMTTREPSHVR